MSYTSKELFDLLNFTSNDAIIHFKDRRMVVFDAEAIGVLRAELINTVGLERAKGILIRFGFACGYNDAKAAHKLLDNEFQQSVTGAAFHEMQGHVKVDITINKVNIEDKTFHREGYWINSYEAEQHLRLLGKYNEPICWTLSGYASGYNTYYFNEPVIYIEDECTGKGDEKCHFVGKPVKDWGDFIKSHLHYYERENIQREIENLKERLNQLQTEVTGKYDFSAIIGHSQEILNVIELTRKVARTDTTILITGESGTGKELVAKSIHYNSNRADGPFIAINCAALPETLLESELFGYERGAFTGAERRKPGRFQLANKGTLFLDEVAEMSPAIQVKLLRVLQDRKYEPVGGTESLHADVRIITATHKNLLEMVEQGTFRDDLFYRLNVYNIHLPPLRDREDDIMLLTQHFLEQFSDKMGREIPSITKEARDLLLKHEWKGNIRELQNALERALILCEGNSIHSEHLPFGRTLDHSKHGRVKIAFGDLQIPDSGIQIDELEKELIYKAITMANGNKSKAAKLLGISRGALRYRLDKFNNSTVS